MKIYKYIRTMISVSLLSVVLLTGCGECEHDWGEGKVTKEATCSEEGEMIFVCSECEKAKTEPIEMIEHSWDNGEVATPSTCVEKGTKIITCKECGEEKTEELALGSHKFDNGVVTKEPTFTDKGEKLFTCEVCGETKTDSIPVRTDYIEVVVTDKSNEEGSYGRRYVNLKFNLTNNADKDVKGVSGVLKVYDLFDKVFISMGCDFTGKIIPSGETIAYDTLQFEINEFMSDHIKFYNENYDDLKFVYELDKIVYASEESNAVSETDEIRLTVTKKKNTTGFYSARVEFTFEIENLTDKEIKGIEGTLSIKDMFGDEIMKFNCDFTGIKIGAVKSITQSGLGFDVNEFMSDHCKVYAENYEDLIFEYEVKNVVYN